MLYKVSVNKKKNVTLRTEKKKEVTLKKTKMRFLVKVYRGIQLIFYINLIHG